VPAGADRPDGDALSRTHLRLVVAYCLDDGRELVSLDPRVERRRIIDRAEIAEKVVEVRAAQTDRLWANEHLADARLARLHHFDDFHQPPTPGDGRSHLHLLGASNHGPVALATAPSLVSTVARANPVLP